MRGANRAWLLAVAAGASGAGADAQVCAPGFVRQFGQGADAAVRTQIVFDPDGGGPLPARLIIGGDFTHAGGLGAAHIASWDGTRWLALSGGVPKGTGVTVDSLAVMSGTPRLYAGGTTGGAAWVGEWDGATWRLLPPMPVEPAADNGGTASGMAVWDDDGAGPHTEQLYVANSYPALAFTTMHHRLLRWDGTSWSVVYGDHAAQASAVLAMPGGAAGVPGVYVSAVTSDHSWTAFTVTRWDGSNPATIGWGSSSGPPIQWVLAIASFPGPGGGPVPFVAGSLTSIGDVPVINAAYWNGSTWVAAGSGAPQFIEAMTAHEEAGVSSLVAVGPFGISRWDGVSWTAPAAITTGGSPLSVASFRPPGEGPALFVGGGFPVAGGVWASNLARSLGAGWAPVGQAPNNSVHALLGARGLGVPDGLYAGGAFTTVGASSAVSLARWDGGAWSAVGDTNNHVDALAAGSVGGISSLFAAGKFTSIAGVSAPHIAGWIGSSWSGLGSGVNGDVSALAIGAGPALYAGGDFTSAGAQPAAHIARWDGAAWSALGAGVNGAVRALAVFNAGTGSTLYAGGEFSAAGGQGAAHIARWNGAGWAPAGGGVDGVVHALAVFDDGTGAALYAGGEFANAGGQPAPGVARWNGAGWSGVGAGLNGAVWALGVVDADGAGPGRAALYAGGAFTASGAVPCARVARWDGSAWSALDSGADDLVLALAGFDADGAGPGQNDLFLGGDFFRVAGVSSSHLARWTTCACYANCDGSTAPPRLNVNDFICFLNRFAAGDPLANCDGSTVPPVLNVGDFTCFLDSYATGCP